MYACVYLSRKPGKSRSRLQLDLTVSSSSSLRALLADARGYRPGMGARARYALPRGRPVLLSLFKTTNRDDPNRSSMSVIEIASSYARNLRKREMHERYRIYAAYHDDPSIKPRTFSAAGAFRSL